MTFYQRLIQDTERDRRFLLDQPIISDCLSGRITLEVYLAFLEQAYHHVRHTVPLLMACGARLPDRLEWLREAVAEYIEEETGHQEWILGDIAACGGDPETVRHGRPGMTTDVMVAYAWDCVTRRNPVGFFGMVLVLEGTSVQLATRVADVIQQQLELPGTGFTYLRSHGVLDQQHIGLYESLVNRLEAENDRRAVLDTARVMYRLYAALFANLPRPEDRRAAA
ncbi:MAG: iron-containing redox enzyme family protein [Lysobacterales bacterium]|jgi:pyrroloquinoline quinone (PQQ) biosynthesis protein C